MPYLVWRRACLQTTPHEEAPVYTVVVDEDEGHVLARRAFQSLTGREVGQAATLPVMMGRELALHEVEAGACLVSFQALCGANLGAADYLSLCGACHTLVMHGVPALTQQCPEARR